MTSLLSTILAPLEKVFAAGVKLRNWGFESGMLPRTVVPIPTICVGNLTVGGNGKTPLALSIAKILRAAGLSPVILTRGYGGSERGPALARLTDTVGTIGDEALMMARRAVAPVVVCRNRVRGARFVEGQQLGNVLVLDDGFQHRWLGRDLDILAIGCGDEASVVEFEEGALLPRGKFREPRVAGLRRAGAVVLVSRRVQRRPELEARIRALLPADLPVFTAHLVEPRVLSAANAAELVPQPVVAFCGLANPTSFFSTLEDLGYSVVERRAFPDHHFFTDLEIADLRARHPMLPTVCSEKDWARLDSSQGENLFVLRAELAVEPVEKFREMLLQTIAYAGYRRHGGGNS